jgi:propionate catabolism operon transcriptional regulator
MSSAQQIREALAACNGNRQEAARYLGISRATLWRRLQAASHETPANAS